MVFWLIIEERHKWIYWLIDWLVGWLIDLIDWLYSMHKAHSTLTTQTPSDIIQKSSHYLTHCSLKMTYMASKFFINCSPGKAWHLAGARPLPGCVIWWFFSNSKWPSSTALHHWCAESLVQVMITSLYEARTFSQSIMVLGWCHMSVNSLAHGTCEWNLR